MGGWYPRFLVALVIKVLAVLFVAGDTAAAGELDDLVAGSWEVKSHDRKNTGEFDYCAIKGHYQSTRVVIFTLDRRDLFDLFVFDPDRKLEDDARYPATLSIDGREIGGYEMKVAGDIGFVIRLPYTDRLVEGLKRGRQLTLRFAETVLRFRLTGTRTGLTDLERCVAEGMRPKEGERSNPFQTPPKSAAAPVEDRQAAATDMQPVAPADPKIATPSGDESSQIRADRRRFFNFGAEDDWAFINRILDSVGLWGFEFIPVEDSRVGTEYTLYAWQQKQVDGGVMGVDTNKSGTELTQLAIDNFFKEKCRAESGPVVRGVEMDSGALAWRIEGKCHSRLGDSARAMLVLLYRSIGIMVYHVGDIEDSDVIFDADERMFGWFRATF